MMVVSWAKPINLFFDSCPVSLQRQAMDFATRILEEFFKSPILVLPTAASQRWIDQQD
jgi:hypothetical protein